MREGWKCPACQRVNSPDVLACPCSDGEAAGRTAPLAPVPPPSSLSTTIGTSATEWQGVTVTYHVTGDLDDHRFWRAVQQQAQKGLRSANEMRGPRSA